MADERRTTERVSVLLDASWEGMSGHHLARVSDISIGGCFVETFGPAKTAEVLDFSVCLPGGRWLQLQGEVTYHQPHVGFGVRFTNLSDEERALIAQLIESARGSRN